MSKMSAVEALMIQRDAVMFGWMPLPRYPNTACAVIRRDASGKCHCLVDEHILAHDILHTVCRELHRMDAVSFNYRITTTLDDMLDLFDAAILRAKELEDS